MMNIPTQAPHRRRSPTYENADNNWQNLVYHPAMQTGANANFSGGSPKGTWFLGMGYLNQDGIVHTSNFKRYSVDFKLEQSMNNWLTVGGNISYNRAYTVTIPDGNSAQHGGTVIAALTVPADRSGLLPRGHLCRQL